MKQQNRRWHRQGGEACAAGFDREQVITVLAQEGVSPVSNEHNAALRGWDQRNVAELREAIRAVITRGTTHGE